MAGSGGNLVSVIERLASPSVSSSYAPCKKANESVLNPIPCWLVVMKTVEAMSRASSACCMFLAVTLDQGVLCLE